MSDSGLPWKTPRLQLRRFTTMDLAAFQDYRTDLQLATYQGWQVVDDEQARRFLEQHATAPLFQNDQWNQLAIINADNQLIGDVGLCVHATWAEVGYTINRNFHKLGYATEALRLSVTQLFALTQVWSVHGITDSRNVASIRVLERAGLQHIDTLTHDHNTTELVYQISRDRILQHSLE